MESSSSASLISDVVFSCFLFLYVVVEISTYDLAEEFRLTEEEVKNGSVAFFWEGVDISVVVSPSYVKFTEP